jgi:hypothetical protein
MGHSTGCQDTIQYLLTKHSDTPINGAILQAPCSDREALSREGLVQVAKLAKEVHDAAFPGGMSQEDRVKKEGMFWDCMPRTGVVEVLPGVVAALRGVSHVMHVGLWPGR